MATVTKVVRRVRGKTYEYYAVRFTDPGTGKEKLRYFGSLKEAKQARTEIESRINGGTFNAKSHSVLVRDIVKKFREAGYFPKGEAPLRSTTIADYETALERIVERWGAMRAVDIRPSMTETWRNELLKQGVGKSPVRKTLIVMSRLFKFARRDHLVTINPTEDVSRPAIRARKGEEERLTPEQLAKLFETLRTSAEIGLGELRQQIEAEEDADKKAKLADQVQPTGRTHVTVRIGAGTGLREGEIFGLHWRDVDLTNREIHVRGQFTHGEFVEHAKTDAGSRTVPIDEELTRILAEWKLSLPHNRKRPDDLVVSTTTGGSISASNFLSREFYPALTAAKLPRVVFHSLRHTYKTILVSSDTPPAVVHVILGHANFATTMKLYGGITADARGKAAEKIAEAFRQIPDKNRTNG